MTERTPFLLLSIFWHKINEWFPLNISKIEVVSKPERRLTSTTGSKADLRIHHELLHEAQDEADLNITEKHN